MWGGGNFSPAGVLKGGRLQLVVIFELDLWNFLCINSKTRLKWCKTCQKYYFINYLINSSLSLISTSTMPRRYLKSFVINSPSKIRSKWCLTGQKKLTSTSWWTPPSPRRRRPWACWWQIFFLSKVVLQLVKCYRRMHKNFKSLAQKLL